MLTYVIMTKKFFSKVKKYDLFPEPGVFQTLGHCLIVCSPKIMHNSKLFYNKMQVAIVNKVCYNTGTK